VSIPEELEKMETSVNQAAEVKVENREDRMWSEVHSILYSDDEKTAWQAACRLAKEYKPGLADKRAQKQLYKDAKPESPESYLQKRLMPLEILRVLSEDYLSEPREVRIGKDWITDVDGRKINIPANKLSRIDFPKWLRAKVYKNITTRLLETKIKEEREPLNNALSLDQYPQSSDGGTLSPYDQVSFSLNESGDPAILLEKQQEARVNADQSAELLSRMLAEASPQGKRYIEGLRFLIKKGEDPSSLNDKELSSLLEISPTRIRQLRSALRKKYK